jgi:hypothetical protein
MEYERDAMISARALILGVFVCSRVGCATGCGFDVCAAPVTDAGAFAGVGNAELWKGWRVSW